MYQKIFLNILTFFLLLPLFSVSIAGAQSQLTLKSMEVKSGNTFRLELTLIPDGKSISALSSDITFNPSVLQIIDVEIGPTAHAVDKIVAGNHVNTGAYKLLILSTTNNDPIKNGIVAYINGSVSSTVPSQTLTLSLNASASDPQGNAITINGVDATLTIVNDNTSNENILTHRIMRDSIPITLSSDSYVQVFGTSGDDIVTIEAGARVEFQNFAGSNEVNLREPSTSFTVHRSGAMVYLKSTAGTDIKIPASMSRQKINFTDGSSDLMISNGRILLGDQVVTETASGVN